jgi:hypothetical protein
MVLCGVAAATWTKLMDPLGGGAPVAKVAVTLWFWLRVTLQLPVPLQAPLQPVKVEPLAGLALSATAVPAAKLALQADPQLIPLGLLVTVPLPVPALATDRVWVVEGGGRVAPLNVTICMTQAPAEVSVEVAL